MVEMGAAMAGGSGVGGGVVSVNIGVRKKGRQVPSLTTNSVSTA